MKVYDASPTIATLLQEYQKYKVITLLGPIGGGKTTGIVMTLLTIMTNQQPDAMGRRRTRFAIVRNTRQQLKDSVVKSVWEWIPPNGASVIWRESDMTQIVTFMLADGTTVHSEWIFRSLDDEDDARKLLSVEYTSGWLSEFREIPYQLLTDLRSRMGRFPSKSDGGASWHGVLAESNMPVEGSDWYKLMEVEQPSWLKVLKQPAAIIPDPSIQDGWMVNPMAENTKWLPSDYYSTLLEGTTHYWKQAMLLCEYPPSLDGKSVFGNTFKRKAHVATEANAIRAINVGDLSPTLLVGIDQGRNPAAVIGQMHPRGTLMILREIFGSNMGMDRFVTELLRPVLNERQFINIPVMAVIDPAGLQKSQVNDLSPADVLKQSGFHVIPAPTNDPTRRIEAVERKLQKVDGLLIDPSCEHLIMGLATDYRFRAKKNGELEDRPEKKHPVSDLQDCLQYIALIAGGVNYGRVISRNIGPARVQRNPGVASWT